MGANINTSPILAIDVISQLHMQLDFESAMPKHSALASQVMDPMISNHPIGTKDKNDCGLLDIEPVRLTGMPPPHD